MKRSVLLASLLATGCGARSEIAQGVTSTSCTADAPICVQSAPNPCDPPVTAKPVCDDSAKQWVCPAGARIYARAADSTGTCRPFHATPGLSTVGPWGLSAMTRVPTDDGRCLWIADSATLSDGTVARNVALAADTTAPFGTCPEKSTMPPTPIVEVEGGNDPTLLVQIDGGYRLGGVTHVLYRMFRVDAQAVFGAVEIGGGVGRWDPNMQRIVVPAPGTFPWKLDLDLGDAMMVADGSHAFVWGCAQPTQNLVQGCELARLDENDAVELFGQDGTWKPTTDASQGAVVFVGGTWQSSVIPWNGAFRHLYVGDFGDRIQTHDAPDPTGPWKDGPDLAACDLPANENAFCAGPIVHAELADPTRPNELPVTYGVGTTGDLPLPAEDGWTRLIWTE